VCVMRLCVMCVSVCVCVCVCICVCMCCVRVCVCVCVCSVLDWGNQGGVDPPLGFEDGGVFFWWV